MRRFWIGAVAGIGLAILWPSDAPWINDEPKLIAWALHCRDQGLVAAHGLIGSRGTLYGPFATWIYTVLLYFIKDLALLVAVRAFLFLSLCALSLAWISQLCPGLSSGWGWAALFSPYLWLYSRELWDNTFLIPLSGVTFCAYLSFCLRAEAWKLWLAALGGLFMLLTHPMSLVVIIPLGAHAWLSRRKYFFQAPFLCATLLAAGAVFAAPYVKALTATSMFWPGLSGFSFWRGWVFPFFAGRLFSGGGFDYFLGPGYLPAGLAFVRAVSRLALLFFWAGIVSAVRQVLRPSAGALGAERDMALLSLITLCFGLVFHGMLRLYGQPHYYGAAWLLYFYFLWKGLSVAPPLFGRIYAGSLAIFLPSLVLLIHLRGGSRTIFYGPTLGNQIELARRIGAYSPESPIRSRVQHYVVFPHALKVLFDFYGLRGTPQGPRRRLAILYKEADQRDGRVILAAE
ncbi:MAG: hypothetical protein HY921_06100 [Elusimicrobia bacterium]|nr:hypothetical protein [Elusimicrobiota bacterium]